MTSAHQLNSMNAIPAFPVNIAAFGRLFAAMCDVMENVATAMMNDAPESPHGDSQNGQSSFADEGSVNIQDLVRGLLLTQHRIDPTIRLAIRLYIEAKRDLSRFDSMVQDIRASLATSPEQDALLNDIAEDLITRGKRQLQHRFRALQDLGVEIHDVAIGDTFSPDVHKAIAFEETAMPELDGTIARVRNDLFTWTDNRGTPQLFESEVIVFAVNGGASAPPDDRHNSACCLNQDTAPGRPEL